jgi:toxin ParE1/3/4
MAQVIWTAEAERWLKEIYDYIAADNPRAAKRTVDAIAAKASLLCRFPELGYRYQSQATAAKNLRIILYGHYRIAYRIEPDGRIPIVGVFHAALDMDRFLT